MRLRHNPFVRRAVKLARQVPRAWARMSAGAEGRVQDPPIVANSFPKSGTHLLLQVAAALRGGGGRDYGTFIATQPVFPYRQRSVAEQARMLSRAAPGEVVAAHLFHDADVERALRGINAAHFFIYRDPRDVVVSEAHYLAHMNRFHRMHRYFASLPTMEERIMAAIRGVPAGAYPHAYPDIATRFRDYAGWLGMPTVCSVRYEDLMGDARSATMERLREFYRRARPDGRAAASSELTASIRPEESRTFRSGGSGGWRTSFTPAHTAAMKEVAGALLVQLGYERDLGW